MNEIAKSKTNYLARTENHIVVAWIEAFVLDDAIWGYERYDNDGRLIATGTVTGCNDAWTAEEALDRVCDVTVHESPKSVVEISHRN